jgi:hypothetical protein
MGGFFLINTRKDFPSKRGGGPKACAYLFLLFLPRDPGSNRGAQGHRGGEGTSSRPPHLAEGALRAHFMLSFARTCLVFARLGPLNCAQMQIIKLSGPSMCFVLPSGMSSGTSPGTCLALCLTLCPALCLALCLAPGSSPGTSQALSCPTSLDSGLRPLFAF